MSESGTTSVRPILKSWIAWLLAFWVALAIHVDWHLGRPGHHSDLSFQLPYHWILGILVFAHLAWVVSRRWPLSFVNASAFIILTGVVIGQGLELLWEVAELNWDWSRFTMPVRWRLFVEFMIAGLLAYVLTARAVLKGSFERAA